MARSINKVILLGNLTRDPELRYTPQGTAVCSFGLATNRQWRTESGELRDEAEFHRIVAWNQLAEICARMLQKGSRVYVEGRIQSRTWTGQDKQQRTTFEIIISDMVALDTRRSQEEQDDFDIPEDLGGTVQEEDVSAQKSKKPKKSKSKVEGSKKKKKSSSENNDEIPF